MDFIFETALGRVPRYCRDAFDDQTLATLWAIPLRKNPPRHKLTSARSARTLSLYKHAGAEETWNRIQISNGAISANPNGFDIDIPDLTWIAPMGKAVSLLVCFAPSLKSQDFEIIPLTHHHFSVDPCGSDVTLNGSTIARVGPGVGPGVSDGYEFSFENSSTPTLVNCPECLQPFEVKNDYLCPACRAFR